MPRKIPQTPNSAPLPDLCPACRAHWIMTPVIVKKDGKNTIVCYCEICACRDFKRAPNSRPITFGAFIHKPDYRFFYVPWEWWLGDWPWRQKFAWELVSWLKGYDVSAYGAPEADFEEIAARVDRPCVPNPQYDYDIREIFGME